MERPRIEFPSDYPIKVVARTREALRMEVDAVFERHFGPLPADGVSERLSARGQFTSLTYVPRVEREEQLRALHAELVTLDGVMMVL
jgi:putative lipoic acid-binding regulatory protein